jgi:uncharacterized Ntn-hydrolase superfamily protein
MSEAAIPMHTYSIVARDRQTGQFGVAVESHAMSVGSVVSWAEAGVGAVATQSLTKIDYGPDGLALMSEGLSAPQALGKLLQADEDREVRQVAMIDAQGDVAVHTGSRCIGAAGFLIGDHFSVQANLMVDDSVWPAMKHAYESFDGEFVDRLITTLEAAQATGGDIRGQQSAAILIVSGEKQEKPWQGRIYDLRVEDHPRPVDELKRLVRLHKARILLGKSRELSEAQKFEESHRALTEALALDRESVELRFWAAAGLFMAGQEDLALPMFREVFAREPIWADLVYRIVPTGRLPNDSAAIERILRERP